MRLRDWQKRGRKEREKRGSILLAAFLPEIAAERKERFFSQGAMSRKLPHPPRSRERGSRCGAGLTGWVSSSKLEQ
jgi:hypothetical protein